MLLTLDKIMYLTNMRAHVLFIFLIVQAQLAPLFAVSQKQSIRFDHLNTYNGLAQNNVSCIFQDSRGFMWLGTSDGLDKYDGYNFTLYKNDSKNTISISNNFITSVPHPLWNGSAMDKTQ